MIIIIFLIFFSQGKCTRKEPPCKYLHPPQHLKDQLLQNGKNNLVLRQVALAMMHQQQQQQTNSQPTAALIAAAAAAAANNSVSQYQFTTSPNGTVQSSSNNNNQQQQTNNNSTNNSTPNQSATPTATPTTTAQTTTTATQFIPTSLTTTNGGLTTYSQVQLATNGNGAQAHLLPMLANGFHPHPHHHLQQMQQAIYATAADPTTAALLQVSAVSPGAANASLLPPQQRTDRLQVNKQIFIQYILKFKSLFLF